MGKRKGYSIYRAKRRNGKGREDVWTVSYRDPLSRSGRSVLRGIASKAIADEIGRAKAALADRVRGGVVSREEARASAASKLPIEKHIEVWQRAMQDRRTKPTHYRHQVARVKKLANLARAYTLGDLESGSMQAALARVSSDSSPQNARHYYVAIKAMVYWCIETGRLTTDPLIALKRPKSGGETFRRTPFPPDKLADLMEAARTRETGAHHAGEDRAMFYAVLAYTGVRKAEAESLTRESFDLDERTVTVRASYTKNGDEALMILRADVAELLRAWLVNKKPGKRVFNFGPRWDCEALFRGDCKAAGIKEGDGERLGVHSLRRMFITQAIRAGGLAVAQDLARHSTPALTKKYADLTIKDHEKGLAGLPTITRPEKKGRKIA